MNFSIKYDIILVKKEVKKLKILLEKNGEFIEVETINEIFENIYGSKGTKVSKQIKITDEEIMNRIFIEFIKYSDSSKLVKKDNYYAVNNCLGINFEIDVSENANYNYDSIIFKNKTNEMLLTVNVIFLEDNFNGDELSEKITIKISCI